MGSPPDHESSSLTPGEWSVLHAIEQRLRASDGCLEVALSDGVLPVPSWLLWVGRAGLALIPLVLLLPFVAWSSIVGVVVTFLLLRSLSSRWPLRRA